MKSLSRFSATAALAALACIATPAQAKWGPWQSLGGKIIGAPTLVSSSIAGTPLLFVAARGTDNALWWTQKLGNGQWTAWKSAGGVITAAPTCISRKPGVIDCFARTSTGEMTQKSMVNGAWNSWYGPDKSPNPALIDGDVTVMNVGSDFLTIVAGAAKSPVKMHWTAERGFSTWAPAKVAGWDKTDGPFVCAQRATGVNSTDVIFDMKFDDIGYQQACVAKTGGAFTLFISGEKGAVLPIPELKSDYAPDINMFKAAEGLRVYMTFTNPSGMVVRRQYTVGKGWTKFPTGALEIVGGSLTSAPSCAAKRCAGRGKDGAVWITAQD